MRRRRMGGGREVRKSDRNRGRIARGRTRNGERPSDREREEPNGERRRGEEEGGVGRRTGSGEIRNLREERKEERGGGG